MEGHRDRSGVKWVKYIQKAIKTKDIVKGTFKSETSMHNLDSSLQHCNVSTTIHISGTNIYYIFIRITKKHPNCPSRGLQWQHNSEEDFIYCQPKKLKKFKTVAFVTVYAKPRKLKKGP